MIFYSIGNASNTEIHYVKPDGTGDTTFAVLPTNIDGFTPDPAVANQVVFSYQADQTSNFGLYKNSTPVLAGATTLIDPSNGYSDISSIQVSNDGAWVYYVAFGGIGTPGQLYKVSINGGTPLALDDAESFQLNPAGTQLVYSKLNGAAADVYVRGVNATDTPTNLTNSPDEDVQPQWNKAGNLIVFSSDKGSTNLNLFTIPAGGGTPTQLTTTGSTASDNIGGSISGDGTMLSFVMVSADSAQSGIYTLPIANSANLNQLVLNATPGSTTYWTTANGRARGPRGSAYNFYLARKRHRHH